MGFLAVAGAAGANSEAAIKPRRTGPSDDRLCMNKAWLNYAMSLAGAPRNRSCSRPDWSMADSTWCMTAIDWGWQIEAMVAKLPEVNEKAHERV